MKKKIFLSIMCLLSVTLLVSGCGKKEANLTYTPTEVVEKVYAGLENDLPMLATIEIDDENLSYYLGVESLDYKEAVASEPMMGSIAHSVVVVRMNEGADIEKAKQEIKDNVDPRKWICVEAESVIVENKGDVIILIMSSSEKAEKIKTNFNNLK